MYRHICKRIKYTMCLCTHAQKCERTNACGGQMFLSAGFFNHASQSLFETGSLSGALLEGSARLFSNPQHSSYLHLPPAWLLGVGHWTDISHLWSKHWARWAISLQTHRNSSQEEKKSQLFNHFSGKLTKHISLKLPIIKDFKKAGVASFGGTCL